MSEQAVEQEVDQGPQGTVDDTQDNVQQDTASAENKSPWHDYLERFPSSLHPVAEEVFKEWDGNVTKRFQDLHSTYKPYEDMGITQWEPESISQAVQLAQSLESDPEAFYRALAQAYGFAESEQGAANQQQQQEVVPSDLDPDDPYAQRFQQLETLSTSLADHILNQERAREEAEMAAQQDAWLDQTMTSLKSEHGEFDEDYVLRAISTGMEPEQAVKQFQGLVSSWAAKQNAPAASAPRVIGGGGNVPSNRVDPAKLSRQETKNLVAEYLRTGQSGG